MTTTTTTTTKAPPIGVKPGWLHAIQRISDLAGAIQRYADEGHGDARLYQIRLWVDEMQMQLDIWEEISNRQQKLWDKEIE